MEKFTKHLKSAGFNLACTFIAFFISSYFWDCFGQDYNITNGAVTTTCSGNFYDPGGPSSNYGNNRGRVHTFVPSTPGSKLKFTFSSFAGENCCDYLNIYDGPSTASPLIGTYININPGTVISTASGGQLTFLFSSDGSVDGAGWQATISCVTAPGAETYGTNVWNSYAYNSFNTNTTTTSPFFASYLGGINASITTNSNSQVTANWAASAASTANGNTCVNYFTTSHLMNRTGAAQQARWRRFTSSSDDGMRISDNGAASWNVRNDFGTGTAGNSTSSPIYNAVNPLIRVDQRENVGDASVNCQICTMNGQYNFVNNLWKAFVFDDKNVEFSKFNGYFENTTLNFCNSWGAGQPTYVGQRCGMTMDNNNFSVRYLGNWNFEQGTYRIRVRTDDGIRLDVGTNGTFNSWNVFNSWNDNTNDLTSGDISLNGFHTFYFDMRENTGDANASINILKVPVNPSGITTNLTNNAICTSGGSITLTATGPEGTVYWYTGSCNGTLIGTGNSITVNPTENTIYYAKNRNYSDVGCGNILELFSPGCATIEVKVGGPTNVDAGLNIQLCSGGSTQFTGSAIGPFGLPQNASAAPNVSIPDNNATGVSSTIVVSNSGLNANQLSSISVNLNHTWDGDLSLTLIAPNGSSIDLSSGNGGSGDNYTNTVFSSSGSSSITTGTAPFTGTFTPEVSISNLTGTADGNWTLKIVDGVNNDMGTLLDWSISYRPILPITYSWSPATFLNATNASNPIASNVTSTQTYTMTSSSNGCSLSDDVTVTVNNAPTIASITAPNALCSGASYSPTVPAVTANGSTITSQGWQIETAVGSNSYTPITVPYTVTFADNGKKVRYSATNGCGTTNTSTVTLIVNPTSVAGTASTDQTICSGATASLTLTGQTGSIQWQQSANGSTGWTNVSTGTGATTSSYTSSALSATTYYRAQVTSGVCSSVTSNVVTITVNPNPIASAGPALSAICQGATSTPMGGSVGGGATGGTWSGGAGSWSNPTDASNATYTAGSSESGTITLTLTTSGGSCGTATATKTITVNPNPTASAGSALSAICQGATSASMGGSVSGGATGGTWSGGAGSWTNSTNASTATYTAGASESGTITLTLTTSGGSCGTTTVTKTITVNPNPTASAGSALSAICQGANSAPMGGSVGGGTTGGTWSGGAGSWTNSTNASTATYTAGASESGTITLTLTTSGGSCGTTTATKTIVVNANPSVTALANPTTICEGQSATLTGGGASTYSWSNGAGSGSSVSVSPTANTTYTVTGTDANGCTNTATATVTVNNTADFANLQWPQSASISCGSSVAVYGKIYDAALTPAAGANATITVEVGVSTSNTDPSTWASSAWSAATFNTQVVNDDEYTANIGGTLAPGTYYYTFRYQIGSTGCYKYGGYNGGFWNGTTNVNGTLTVNGSILDYANVQFPLSGSICSGGEYSVYGQVYEAGVTNGAGAAAGMIAEIGVSSSNTDPSTWAAGAWSAATFNSQVGNNDEFVATIGSALSAGTYYYAFRYKLASACNYQYGATNGFWNGTSNTNGVLTVGSATTTSVSSGDYIWKGTTNTDWSTATNWLSYNGSAYSVASTPPAASNKVIIPAPSAGCVTTQPATITNLSGVANDIVIESGASLGLSSATLSVHGNWTNNGTFTPGTGTVAFVGATGNQSITKTGGESFAFMTVNKASGNVVLNNDVTVVGGLTLTSGKVDLGENNLSMGGATLTGGSSASYIKTSSTGSLKRNLGNSGWVLFPVGNAAYNPAELTNTVDSDVFSVRVVDAVYVNGTSGTLQTSSVVNRTWMIDEETQGGNSVKMRLYWNGAGEEATSFAASSAFIAHYVSSSSMWDNMGGGAGLGYVESTQATTSFSPFTISSSPTFAPLPVELLSLDAQCAGENVIVSWKTASEHNSLNYVVERSENGTTWSEVQTLAAAGNSNTVLEYAIEDAGAARGVKYYRLIQTDQDGVQKIYGPVLSNCGSDNNLFMSFPNPSDADITIVFNDKNIIGSTTLTVRDAHGRVVRSIALEIQPGTTSVLLPDMELEPAVYYLQLEGDNFTSPVIKHSLR